MIVNIKYINPPRQPGGRYGNLKLADGTTLMCPVDMLNLFRTGVCEVNTKQQVWGQGTATENTVTVVTSGPYGSSAPSQGLQSPPPPRNEFQPRVYQGGAGKAAPKSDEEQRNMFIMGVVGRAMSSGKFTASEIAVLTKGAAEAWDGLQAKPTPQGPPEPPPAPMTDYPSAG